MRSLYKATIFIIMAFSANGIISASYFVKNSIYLMDTSSSSNSSRDRARFLIFAR
ncbi:hypothetical protein SAMN05444274_11048 [Mariniphaga anaerophila]|uniref:Uncharacterized protein n=1 Tax=Mariniphaga anaerophila TaxID=1484053 RepID=A0A1M5EVS0_9BACT|nr:hypothetical protein SAMN05444274_11048 [Mariniphaga anaerophila]